jgi:hypothetical protein
MVGAGDIYYPLLRNHRYELTITGVRNEGFLMADSAVRSINSQLIAEFITWNESNQNVIIDQTQYTLKVLPSTDVVLSRQSPLTLTLETNYPNASWMLGEPTVEWFECGLTGNKVTVAYKAASTPPASGSVGFFKVKLMDGSKQKVSQQIKVVYN